jgi:hypothetical protein
MSPIAEILFTLAVTAIGVVLGYRAGCRTGFEYGIDYAKSINNDRMRHIKLPTSDEVKKQAEERFPL